MFLSQLLVNPGTHPDKPRPGLDWVKQTYRVHQRIWMAFPDKHRLKEDPFFLGTWSPDQVGKPQRDEGGFLFRVEPDAPPRILVQSAVRPRWDYAFKNAPFLLAGEPQVREFDPAFKIGDEYRFRLVMQMVTRRRVPTAKLQEGQKSRSEHPIRCLLPPDESGKRMPDPEFGAWRSRLEVVAAKSGFTVGHYPTQLHVRPVTNLTMKPTGREAADRFHAAMFEGLLRCDDPGLLRHAVVHGVGRGKAFGMGLLSLAIRK